MPSATERNVTDRPQRTPASRLTVGNLPSMVANPSISVVVATYRRSHLLDRLVSAVEQQVDAGDVELVIVDDASPDDTTVMLRRLSACAQVDLVPLRLPRNAGPATARNTGWRAARGALIAFTDDDCVPQPGWLAALASALSTADVAQGRTLPNPDQAANVGPFSRTLEVTEENGWYQTCNIGYRRSLLERLGGFDEAFPDAAGEDTDLAWRARDAGATITFVPDALVFHDIRPSRFTVSLRDTRRWRSAVLAVKKHPSLRQRFHRRYVWRASHPPAMAAGAGLLLALLPGPWWRRPVALGLVLPYVRFRTTRAPLPGSPRRRVAAIPFCLVIDLAEVGVLVRASARQRTLLL